jgi:hypothetical protein
MNVPWPFPGGMHGRKKKKEEGGESGSVVTLVGHAVAGGGWLPAL